MGLLSALEHRIEAAIDGLFARVFRGPISPRAVLQAVEEAVRCEPDEHGRPVATNELMVFLHPDDERSLAPRLSQLVTDSRERVRRTAAAHGWQLLGSPLVHIRPEADGLQGQVRIAARVNPAAAQAALVPVNGGTPFELGAQPMVIGRDDGCEISLPSSDISRRHARIELRAGEFTVSDLGSTNGTTVNGERVSMAALHDGDVVGFGPLVYQFQEQ